MFLTGTNGKYVSKLIFTQKSVDEIFQPCGDFCQDERGDVGKSRAYWRSLPGLEQ